MFANPEVSAFIDRLIGGQTPRGGTPPQSQGSRTDLARALLGDITKPAIRGGFSAPAIEAYRHPLTQPLPSEGVGRSSGSGAPGQADFRGGDGNTGASGLAAGIGKVGAGIESGLEQLAANKQAADEKAALSQGGAFPKFGGGVGGAGETASSGGNLPSFARPGIGTGPVGASIGGVEGLPQFLNGIKAGEGVPYSGQSSTGAIGAYGLTGGFIKQYAPGAGLPTDRASYMNNPGLQDKLAAAAATQMYNKFGSWPSVANAWLTGSPTATTSAPGNMSPAAYVAKVMRAAGMSQAPTGMVAQDQAQDRQQDAADAAKPGQSAQPVIPGQSNPHLPGFDPKSVPFTNTPVPQAPTGIGQQGMLYPSQDNPIAAPARQEQDYFSNPLHTIPPGSPEMPKSLAPIQDQQFPTGPGNLGIAGIQINPLALALSGGQMPPIDPNFGGLPSGLFG